MILDHQVFSFPTITTKIVYKKGLHKPIMIGFPTRKDWFEVILGFNPFLYTMLVVIVGLLFEVTRKLDHQVIGIK
jgi:hypothetical protein